MQFRTGFPMIKLISHFMYVYRGESNSKFLSNRYRYLTNSAWYIMGYMRSKSDIERIKDVVALSYCLFRQYVIVSDRASKLMSEKKIPSE